MRIGSLTIWALIVAATVGIFGCSPHNGPLTIRGDLSDNPISSENALAGSPPSEWELPNGDPGPSSLQGFSTDISVNRGGNVSFKITSSNAAAYHVDIYRMGYYGGNGARKITSLLDPVPQDQGVCNVDNVTHLVDCGNWSVSATWTVPANETSGIHFARLTKASDPTVASRIVFIVRDDASTSGIVFQTSDQTWQAYNDFGSFSLYPPNQVHSVSYNRPFSTADFVPYSWVFATEYRMVRWLEGNGFDVSYMAGVDSDRHGGLIRNHKVFLSVGHDEYWTGTQRTNVEQALAAGVNLAFFSGNEIFWKTRFEADATGAAYRILTCYKEGPAKQDPLPNVWTGTWRDPRFSPPADGGRPEHSLSGTFWSVQGAQFNAMTVFADEGKLWFWRNTPFVSQLPPGGMKTIDSGCNCTLGYEWDEDPDDGFRPAGSIRLSTTVAPVANHATDWDGSTTYAENATHHLTLYRHPSGALVFGAGTVNWAWGLDSHGYGVALSTPSVDMQQATVNLLADMGQKPVTLFANLMSADPSNDSTPPTTQIQSPASLPQVDLGTVLSLVGTDTGGLLAGIEVSVDGGSTWHPADRPSGAGQPWTWTWIPDHPGSVTILSRGTDDKANIETPGAGLTLQVLPQGATAHFFSDSEAAPHSQRDPAAKDGLELGVKFRSDVAGTVTGVRFYKPSGNSGIHTGSLWDPLTTASPLATGTFTSESSFGWQDVTFATPVQIAANKSYVVSYHTTTDLYAESATYFWYRGVDRVPLHALRDGADGVNGFYQGGPFRFPSTPNLSTNYWVDVDFTPGMTIWPASTTPSTISGDAQPVELGVKFRSDVAGQITGIRFYKGSSNTGTHIGNLWSKDGTRLATATFENETDSGWQQVTFSQPVDIAANTTYIASYHTNAGHFADDIGYFASSGHDNLPLHALQNGADGGNSVYDYSASSTFPANSASAQNYWVDVAFTPTYATGDTIWPPTATPRLISADAQAAELGVKFRSDVAGQIKSIRFYKGNNNSGSHVGNLWSASGALLGTANFSNETSSGWQQVDLSSPVTIAANTTYVASYHTNAGHFADDVGGFATAGVDNTPLHALQDGADGPNAVYAYSVSSAFPSASGSSQNYWVDVVFTASAPATGGTIWPASTTPSTISSDALPVELGVKFRSDVAGQVSSIRFYKGSGNTGTHIGNLWSTNGTLLATATFANESASGWQQLDFTQPVTIAANTTYVASYHTNAGHFADDVGYFGSAGFDSPPLHALKDGTDGGNGVYAYGASGYPAFTGSSQNYWVDVVFNPTSVPGQSIWSAGTIPSSISSDAQPVELGMKFRSDVAGQVKSIRFYKGTGNTGTHTGNLWTTGGTLLGTTMFTQETNGGWQQADFAAPITIAANTTYIASYHTNAGHFADDIGYFTSSGFDDPPLHALKDGQDGGNDVYVYSASSAFPSQTGFGQNYWVDLVFVAGP